MSSEGSHVIVRGDQYQKRRKEGMNMYVDFLDRKHECVTLLFWFRDTKTIVEESKKLDARYLYTPKSFAAKTIDV
jgi:hypothetical protein